MLPVGVPETGGSVAVSDTRTAKNATKYAVTGKFLGSKPSSLAVSATIQIPAGLGLGDFASCDFGVSSFHSTFTLNTKGVVTGNTDAAHFTKPKVKLPKFDKKSGKTIGLQTLTVTFTMTGTDLVSGSPNKDGGFDTDGISHPANGTKVSRNLQFAAVVAGMTYVGTLDGILTPPKKPNGDFGSFQGRSSN